MHSVCCCSLPVWRRSSLKKGTPCDLFWPRPGSAPGRIWPKNNNTCKGPWVLHPYQVSSKSIKRFWRRSWKCKLSNGRQTTDDGRQTTDDRRRTDGRTPDNAWSHKITGAFGSCALKTPPKTSITQQLRTYFRRSVGVAAVNPTGVVKPGLRAHNLPTHHKSSVINRTW